MNNVEQNESYMEPHELDALNRPQYDEDDLGGMTAIVLGIFTIFGAIIGGLVTYFIFG